MRLRCSFCGRDQHQVRTLFKGLNGKDLPGNVYICDECVVMCSDKMKGEERAKAEETTQGSLKKLPTPAEIKAELDRHVVSQERTKRFLSVAVYNHYKRILLNPASSDIEIQKSNIMLLGPTGSGKTLLAQTLARIIDVPFAIADATTLTQAGYVGEDVENILLRLIQSANGDLERASRGIIYIDELDKIAKTHMNLSITRDVSGEGVQQALLKILEGTLANVPPQGGRKHPHQEYLKIDTTNILFIGGGAFNNLTDIVRKRVEQRTMGFGAEVKSKQEIDVSELFSQVTFRDLIAFGLIPEFVGRFPVIAPLGKLGRAEMMKILTEPRNAITKQYKKLFEMEGMNLVFDTDALEAIVDEVLKMETGARGLRAVLEQVMIELQFNLPEKSREFQEVRVTAAMVREKAAPIYVQREKKESA